MKRKLLLRAAEVLSKIPKQQFDLDAWLQGKGQSLVQSGKKLTKAKALQCGTLACAGGWLGVTPEFQKKGLTFKRIAQTSWDGNKEYSVELMHTDPKAPECDRELPDFEGLARLFDISEDDSMSLFSYAGGGDYDYSIYNKHGDDISDRDLFQYRVKKIINQAKRGRK